jgi:hypothetical protein
MEGGGVRCRKLKRVGTAAHCDEPWPSCGGIAPVFLKPSAVLKGDWSALYPASPPTPEGAIRSIPAEG